MVCLIVKGLGSFVIRSPPANLVGHAVRAAQNPDLVSKNCEKPASIDPLHVCQVTVRHAQRALPQTVPPLPCTHGRGDGGEG